LVVAAIILLAIVCLGFAYVQTYKPDEIRQVSYEEVKPIPQSQTTTATGDQSDNDIATTAIPPVVVSFIQLHQQFDLNGWLKDLNAKERQAFLKNLASILTEAKANNVANKDIEEVVSSFGDAWVQMNIKDKKTEDEILSERVAQAGYAFDLVITLTVLCMILVLLAVERNTRLAKAN